MTPRNKREQAQCEIAFGAPSGSYLLPSKPALCGWTEAIDYRGAPILWTGRDSLENLLSEINRLPSRV